MVVRESFLRQREEQDERVRNTMILATAVFNWGGPRSKKFRTKPLGYLYEKLVAGGARQWTKKEVADGYREIRERSLERKRRRVARGELPPGEEQHAADPDT